MQNTLSLGRSILGSLGLVYPDSKHDILEHIEVLALGVLFPFADSLLVGLVLLEIILDGPREAFVVLLHVVPNSEALLDSVFVQVCLQRCVATTHTHHDVTALLLDGFHANTDLVRTVLDLDDRQVAEGVLSKLLLIHVEHESVLLFVEGLFVICFLLFPKTFIKSLLLEGLLKLLLFLELSHGLLQRNIQLDGVLFHDFVHDLPNPVINNVVALQFFGLLAHQTELSLDFILSCC